MREIEDGGRGVGMCVCVCVYVWRGCMDVCVGVKGQDEKTVITVLVPINVCQSYHVGDYLLD